MGAENNTPPPRLTAAGFRFQRLPLLVAFAFTAAVGGTAVGVSAASGRIAVMDLMSDPAEVTGMPWYLGAASSVNLLVWSAGAALYLVAGMGLRRHDARLATALTALGVLTLVFSIDDALLLHEIAMPRLLGLPQIVTLAVYGIAMLAILLVYRAELMRLPEVDLLVVAALALGGSVLLDVLGWDTVVRRVAEEVLKLLGATVWAALPASVIVRRLASPGADNEIRVERPHHQDD